jgi:hypothetical protein
MAILCKYNYSQKKQTEKINGTFESSYVDESSIADDIEITLWGFHKFNDMTSPYADV